MTHTERIEKLIYHARDTAITQRASDYSYQWVEENDEWKLLSTFTSIPKTPIASLVIENDGTIRYSYYYLSPEGSHKISGVAKVASKPEFPKLKG